MSDFVLAPKEATQHMIDFAAQALDESERGGFTPAEWYAKMIDAIPTEPLAAEPRVDIHLGLGERIIGHAIWKGMPCLVFTPAPVKGEPGQVATGEIPADRFSPGAVVLRFDNVGSLIRHVENIYELGEMIEKVVRENALRKRARKHA